MQNYNYNYNKHDMHERKWSLTLPAAQTSHRSPSKMSLIKSCGDMPASHRTALQGVAVGMEDSNCHLSLKSNQEGKQQKT